MPQAPLFPPLRLDQAETMACLTVCQPWAWAIIHWIKEFENRPRPFKHRGSLLIHAGKSMEWWWNGVAAIEGMRLDSPWPSVPVPLSERNMAFGAIIGVCEVIGCWGIERSIAAARHCNPAQALFISGPYALQLARRTPFPKPIPYRGAQGLFRVPHAVVRDQLAAVRWSEKVA